MLPVKEGKNKKLFFSCVKGPWLSPNVKNAHSFWSDCAEAVQGLSYFLPPPPTVGCNTEIYEWIMEEQLLMRGKGIVLYRKEKEASEASGINPRLHSWASPLIYQDAIFSCTWNSNGFMGINNDSCEANIRDFRGSINAGGIRCLNSPNYS